MAVAIKKCPTRKSIPQAPMGVSRDRHTEPKLTRSQKKLIKEFQKEIRYLQFKARKALRGKRTQEARGIAAQQKLLQAQYDALKEQWGHTKTRHVWSGCVYIPKDKR